MTRKKGTPKPTWTSLVVDCLTRADDFMPLDALVSCTGARNNNVIGATLHHLSKYKVIDNVVGADGRLWWFVTGDDTRLRALQERVPEDCKRAPRKLRNTVTKRPT